jgi:spermidine/putrescine transport system permease protein
VSVETITRPIEVRQPSWVARFGNWVRNPWDQPRFLRLWTILYLVWAIVPILIAIQFSFNAGRSRTVWQGFSLQWYCCEPNSVWIDDSLRLALVQSFRLAIMTMFVATPIGVALAVGLARWRGRGGRPANFLMLFPLVTPEIVMGVALFLVFTRMPGLSNISLGTPAQFLGHVTFSISFVVIIVRGRLFAIGRGYEEAAMDLGADQWESIRRVLLPLLSPAIMAAFAIAFALSIDDFVISQFLQGGATTVTIPVRLYSTARLAPPPSLNGLATIGMLLTFTAVITAGLALRAARKRGVGDRGGVESVGTLEI